ncbi:SMP-30/gluconolactonase/LRE family protein [soil metagenome]
MGVLSQLGGFGLVLTGAVLAVSQAPEAIPGIGPAGALKKLYGDFVFTEGPAADAEGNLFFTDVRASKIYQVDIEGNLSTFLEDSQGCNGLMFDAEGRLLACQGLAKRIIAIDPKTKKVEILADQYEGRPFDRPNDLVVDRSGGIYFTDPSVGVVYYVAKGGWVSLVAEGLQRPNGVLLTPDEKHMVLLPSGTPDVLRFPIESPGKLGPAEVFCRLEQGETGQPRGGDGLTVDTEGNLYLAQPGLGALQVVDPQGKTLGLIPVPENPANCAFGGPDNQTLFITARTSLYAAPMEATGHRFGSSTEEP